MSWKNKALRIIICLVGAAIAVVAFRYSPLPSDQAKPISIEWVIILSTLSLFFLLVSIWIGLIIRKNIKSEQEEETLVVNKPTKETTEQAAARLAREEEWRKTKKRLGGWLFATCLILALLIIAWKIEVVSYVRQAMASNSRPVSTVTTVTRTRAPQVPKSGHAELWVDDQHWEEFEILHEDVEIHHFTDGPVVIIPPHGSPVKSYPKEVTVWPKDTQRKGIWRVQALNPGPRFRDTWTWD